MGYRIVSIVSRWRVLDVSLRFDDGSGDLDVGEKMLYSFVEIRYTGKVFSFLDLVNVFKYWFFFSRYFISESYPWFVSFGFCLIILWAILCVVSCDEIFILFYFRSYNAATIFSNLRLKFFPKISHDRNFAYQSMIPFHFPENSADLRQFAKPISRLGAKLGQKQLYHNVRRKYRFHLFGCGGV